MEYTEIEKKVQEYRKELFKEWVKANDNIEHKIGDVICHRQWENGKLRIKQYVYVDDVSVSKEGEFKGYFLRFLTPTGRISVNGFFYTEEGDSRYWANGKHYVEALTPRFNSLKEYKEVILKTKNKK